MDRQYVKFSWQAYLLHIFSYAKHVFNPITPGQKFDKDALYIRIYLPEIANLPNKFIFTPWLADKETLKEANITLGVDYPLPIIDYTESRKKALDAFKKISN